MKSACKFVGGLAAVFAATVGSVAANPTFTPVPEPGSLALVGLAIGVLALVARKKK